MAILKCKMCGGSLDVSEDMSVAECEYCGTRQTVPKLDDEKKLTLFSRANRLRLNNEFDKAAGIYESIIADFPEEAEAYWGLVLCTYGIEYVDDPATAKKVPTCHRSSFDSVMDDTNFEQACENADAIARRLYRDEAKAIEELRKRIIEVSSKEEPYDVFISYKELDENGERTIDSVIAQDIYRELTDKGYRVFFSRISLEDKLGVEYEPYIFAALNSARVMLAVGTDFENFNAVWVKNEWSRFLMLIARGEKKTLIPCFKGIDAYDMPKEFNKLAAQDMGKVGAMQDLIRGVEKILGGKKEEAPVQQTFVSSGPQVSALLERGFMFLEDKEWSSADEYFDKVLDIEPKNGEAYYGKLFVELNTLWDGEISARKFAEGSKNYKRFSQFGTETRKSELDTLLAEYERKANILKLTKRGAVIENNVFVKLSSDSRIKTLYIPEGVTTIGNNAFRDCKALTEVHIPDNVTSIGDSAFSGCDALKEVHIPESVTSIGKDAFFGCHALTEIHIPESVTSIGYGAFNRCDGLANYDGFVIIRNVLYHYCGRNILATVPDSVMSIGNGAFFECEALKEVYIPNSVTSIGEDAFAYCYALTEVHLPDSVKSIGEGAFFECKALKEVHIPNSVMSIGREAFAYCKTLKEMHIPDSVTSIGDGVFVGCDGLANYDGFVIIRNVLYHYCGRNILAIVPDGVTSIGCCAFSDCEALKEVHIPDSVTSIGGYAFSGCEKLSIISKSGSFAEKYAMSNKLKFVSMEEHIAAAKRLEEERIAAAKRFEERLEEECIAAAKRVEELRKKAEEARTAAEAARLVKRTALTAEREKLTAELSNLQGIFKVGQRKKTEARLAEIELLLKKL